MSKLKQWLVCIIFLGAVPTVVFFKLAQHMQHHEAVFYAIGVPPLLLYFYVLGRLGFDIPDTTITKIESGTEIDAYNICGYKITSSQLAGKIILRLRGITIFFVLPIFGAYMIFHCAQEGWIEGYIIGPAMIWLSGGFWALFVKFFSERRKASMRAESET